MIKKVSSWVLGSFFRQFGRFLFFLVLGGLVVLLVQHNNINFKWTDLLGIETIKADTIQPLGFEFKGEDGNTLQQISGAPPYVRGYYQSINNSGTGGTMPFYLRADKSYYPYSNFDYVLINMYTYVIGSQNVYQEYNNYLQNYENGLSFYVEMITNGTWSQCNLENTAIDGDIHMYTIKCPKAKNVTGIQKFNVQWHYSNSIYNTTGQNAGLYIGLSYSLNFISGDSATIVENQNQNTQDINNTLTDTNTTSDISTADTFFNETNSTSESAIVDIVSTPLTLLNNLSVGTFNDICATLNNKQICLPSGDIIWNRQHGGQGVHDHWFRGGSTQAFITFFNLVVGGFILYKCLISLFHSVHKMLDPVNTYVEVMKL